MVSRDPLGCQIWRSHTLTGAGLGVQGYYAVNDNEGDTIDTSCSIERAKLVAATNTRTRGFQSSVQLT